MKLTLYYLRALVATPFVLAFMLLSVICNLTEMFIDKSTNLINAFVGYKPD